MFWCQYIYNNSFNFRLLWSTLVKTKFIFCGEEFMTSAVDERSCSGAVFSHSTEEMVQWREECKCGRDNLKIRENVVGGRDKTQRLSMITHRQSVLLVFFKPLTGLSKLYCKCSSWPHQCFWACAVVYPHYYMYSRQYFGDFSRNKWPWKFTSLKSLHINGNLGLEIEENVIFFWNCSV